MADALDQVRYTFTSLDKQYNALRVACVDDGQRDALADKYDAAEEAYDKRADQMLSDGDAAIAVLSKQLKDANAVVDGAVKQMGNMSKVIDGITQAISIGAKLVSAAGL